MVHPHSGVLVSLDLNLEDIMRREMSQSPKDKHYDSLA